MLLRKTLFVALLSLFVVASYGQRPKGYNGGAKSVYTQKRFNYKAARVRGEKAKIVCPIFVNSKYPFHGFGFKLGDPFALTYKFYANKNLAFVLDAGRPASSLYNRYYREKFDTYIVTDTFSTAEARLIPITHKVKFDIVADAKVLYHVDVTKISAGLQLYVGAGWEWKRTSLQYDYTYSTGDFRNLDEFGRFERNRFTMGPQVIFGIEYAYFHIPISAFMELEYFSDIQLDPGYSRLEGGVGLRYIF
jgi:hypothetical protein